MSWRVDELDGGWVGILVIEMDWKFGELVFGRKRWLVGGKDGWWVEKMVGGWRRWLVKR